VRSAPFLGAAMTWTVEFVEDIPLEASGSTGSPSTPRRLDDHGASARLMKGGPYSGPPAEPLPDVGGARASDETGTVVGASLSMSMTRPKAKSVSSRCSRFFGLAGCEVTDDGRAVQLAPAGWSGRFPRDAGRSIADALLNRFIRRCRTGSRITGSIRKLPRGHRQVQRPSSSSIPAPRAALKWRR